MANDWPRLPAGAPKPPNLSLAEHNRLRLLAWADSDEVNSLQRWVLRWLARMTQQ